MELRIALAGNPNSGKTTLFNALTGSNQFVGNWPGVTVEQKIGKLKTDKNIDIIDLPGVYSLSPYTLEEVVARNYLLDENPEVILNIIDGTNLERNLYLTTQLLELGIPTVIALNMADIINKNGDIIDIDALSKELNSPIIKISALKGEGIDEAAQEAQKISKNFIRNENKIFSNEIEKVLEKIQRIYLTDISDNYKRWYSIKLFEKDQKVLDSLNLSNEEKKKLLEYLGKIEKDYDDDTESIITDQRYNYVTSILKNSYKKLKIGELTTSDKIDKIVTNKYLALPIFALVMFLVYFLSVTTIGTWTNDFINEGVFGDGFFLFSSGRSEYEEALGNYDLAQYELEAFEDKALSEGIDPNQAKDLIANVNFYNDEGIVIDTITIDYDNYITLLNINYPNPSNYGIYVIGIPVALQNWLESVNCASWLQSLILNGIVSGVGAVLGFVPQIFVLFFILSFLEACGYMARVAFVLDKLFRKFGLSGKSFIPMLIGTGCGVPGIMASRTIENIRDRRMTIITTTFIPCSAKLPVIALIAGALFGGAWWVAPTAYLLGVFAIISSGIILKKTRMFRGEPAPFIMELPAYHWPTLSSLLLNTWDRGWSFVKKAGTIILLATVIIWILSNFGFVDGRLELVEINNSILAYFGSLISIIFVPLGWGHWQGSVATLTGLIAKENIVGTFGVLFGNLDEVSESGWQIWTQLQTIFSPLSAFSFLIFNLLCAPCLAAMSAISKEMNSAKWTWFAILYQCGFAYAVSFVIYQLGSWFYNDGSLIGTLIALLILGGFIYMLFKPIHESEISSIEVGV